MHTRVTVPFALLAAALLGAGCAGGGGPAAGTPPPDGAVPASEARSPDGAAATGGSAPAAVPPAGTAGEAGAFNATDVAWLQLHVAMTERLLPVLDLVPARTTDPAWQRLAARVATTHRADLARSRRLLADSGAPATNPHEGHDMPGMVTAEELAALRAATGVPLHQLLARHLRAHLAQAVRLAAAEQHAGAHPATTALAAAIARESRSALARLDRLDQASLPGTAR
ncbi:DUF305 domain-containing protein [Micromonospora sp. LZ34]